MHQAVGGVAERFVVALCKIRIAHARHTEPIDRSGAQLLLRQEVIRRDDLIDRLEEDIKQYLVKLRAQAIIEWRNQELKKAYDQGLLTPAKS